MNSLSFKTQIGSLLNIIPYSCVPGIGQIYNKSQNEINLFESLGITEKQNYVYNRVYKIVSYAVDHIPFYKSFYQNHDFSLSQLKSFDDIDRIPIITKKDLMQVPLEDRSAQRIMSYIANTGGSTGTPLTFKKMRAQQIKEMAYYYSAWSRLGYSKSDVRLQFIGGSSKKSLSYDITRNRLMANIYMPFGDLLKTLSYLPRNKRISYLQGYPSVLYDFATYIEENMSEYQLSGLKGVAKGVFLNSEYPYPQYREKIERVLGVKTIASYGHTEGCALAFDYGLKSYDIMQSYGFVEAKTINGEKHLICTSYDNYASPFIRYDTGDIIDNLNEEDGLLQSFTMTDGGRSGQFIYDKNGKRISLTGLIFGRHHKLFNYCRQMQIAQPDRGKAIVYYTADSGNLCGREPKDLFDDKDIEMDFVFERIDQPIRTKAGKVLLLVSPSTR